MKNQFKNKKAFTLIELLIVIAIIGILFIVLVSKVDFATDKAKATGVQTDFRSFQVALDTVAKENAGFNTFGYNTGDNAGAIPSGYAFESTEAENKTKGDGIRNSYDQGDKNLNGKQDVGEVFTGRKIYTEEWTEVYTLVKPGTTGLDADAVFALESAINKNLDPKLHITINTTDGKITMANQARDPWKNEYHGVYISQAERDNGADRGAIIIYSNGANGKWGSAHDITNGVVTVTVPGNNTYGKDDYSLVSCYTFTNGYGEVLNMSTGFSNNQNFMSNNGGSPTTTGGNAGSVPSKAAGLYNASGFTSWEELTQQNGLITLEGTAITKIDETTTGELIIPNGITAINDWAGSLSLISSVIIPDSVTYIGEMAFSACGNLSNVVLGNGVTTIGAWAFSCTRITSIEFPSSLTSLNSAAFEYCSQLTTVKFKGTVEQWNSISKLMWYEAIPATYVQCSNGQVPLN